MEGKLRRTADKYTADIELSNMCRNLYVSRLKLAEKIRGKIDTSSDKQDVTNDTYHSGDKLVQNARGTDSQHLPAACEGGSSLDIKNGNKTQHIMKQLHHEFASLVDMDLSLLRQLLMLNEQIEELKWHWKISNQNDYNSISSSSSKTFSSTTTSTISEETILCEDAHREFSEAKYPSPSVLSLCDGSFESMNDLLDSAGINEYEPDDVSLCNSGYYKTKSVLHRPNSIVSQYDNVKLDGKSNDGKSSHAVKLDYGKSKAFNENSHKDTPRKTYYGEGTNDIVEKENGVITRSVDDETLTKSSKSVSSTDSDKRILSSPQTFLHSYFKNAEKNESKCSRAAERLKSITDDIYTDDGIYDNVKCSPDMRNMNKLSNLNKSENVQTSNPYSEMSDKPPCPPRKNPPISITYKDKLDISLPLSVSKTSGATSAPVTQDTSPWILNRSQSSPITESTSTSELTNADIANGYEKLSFPISGKTIASVDQNITSKNKTVTSNDTNVTRRDLSSQSVNKQKLFGYDNMRYSSTPVGKPSGYDNVQYPTSAPHFVHTGYDNLKYANTSGNSDSVCLSFSSKPNRAKGKPFLPLDTNNSRLLKGGATLPPVDHTDEALMNVSVASMKGKFEADDNTSEIFRDNLSNIPRRSKQPTTSASKLISQRRAPPIIPDLTETRREQEESPLCHIQLPLSSKSKSISEDQGYHSISYPLQDRKTTSEAMVNRLLRVKDADINASYSDQHSCDSGIADHDAMDSDS